MPNQLKVLDVSVAQSGRLIIAVLHSLRQTGAIDANQMQKALTALGLKQEEIKRQIEEIDAGS